MKQTIKFDLRFTYKVIPQYYTLLASPHNTIRAVLTCWLTTHSQTSCSTFCNSPNNTILGPQQYLAQEDNVRLAVLHWLPHSTFCATSLGSSLMTGLTVQLYKTYDWRVCSLNSDPWTLTQDKFALLTIKWPLVSIICRVFILVLYSTLSL